MGYFKNAVLEFMERSDWNTIIENALDEIEGHDELKDGIKTVLWEYGEQEWKDNVASQADLEKIRCPADYKENRLLFPEGSQQRKGIFHPISGDFECHLCGTRKEGENK